MVRVVCNCGPITRSGNSFDMEPSAERKSSATSSVLASAQGSQKLFSPARKRTASPPESVDATLTQPSKDGAPRPKLGWLPASQIVSPGRTRLSRCLCFVTWLTGFSARSASRSAPPRRIGPWPWLRGTQARKCAGPSVMMRLFLATPSLVCSSRLLFCSTRQYAVVPPRIVETPEGRRVSRPGSRAPFMELGLPAGDAANPAAEVAVVSSAKNNGPLTCVRGPSLTSGTCVVSGGDYLPARYVVHMLFMRLC